MTISVLLREEVYFQILKEDLYIQGYISFENEKYHIDDSFPGSFELGFYNWLIEGEQLIGVNFRLHAPYDKKLQNLLLKNNSPQLLLVNDDLNIFFTESGRETDYYIDYCDNFVDFFLFRSGEGTIALTFEIPDNVEYQISTDTFK